ncbi:MAG TPA: hypothetical protein VJB94_04340 [Candidatus Nanoarchaeia archaeon]|nr:hypothetical protein [Candidatus Nanoarchaeia archaeon]
MAFFSFGFFEAIIPTRCSLGIPEVRCDRIRATENGVEILVKNYRTANVDKSYLSHFSVYLYSCNKNVEAKNGLFKGEEEKLVFEDCNNGEAGTKLESDLFIDYTEGWQGRTISRTSNGRIKIEITY